MMSDICVVHLVRAVNGREPFERFIESYKLHSAGIAHDLLLVFKGFTDNEFKQYSLLVGDVKCLTERVSDRGFDLNAYFLVMNKFEYKYFYFLNSFSVILDNDWLEKSYRYLTCDGVGLVGATGSYESIYSSNIPRGVFHGQADVKLSVRMVAAGIKRWLIESKRAFEYKRSFKKYPNYHIRTNAFMMSRETWQRIKQPEILTKEDAHKFESGKMGLTGQIMKMGKRVLIVGRDGRAYEKEEWPWSNTFRHGGQSNLLISDNQTLKYQVGDDQTKNALEKCAWKQD